MDSLQEIMGKKSFEEPDEMSALKDYVKRHYSSPCAVRIEKQTIILGVPNSALAGTLQLEKDKIIKECRLTKKLLIRTGS